MLPPGRVSAEAGTECRPGGLWQVPHSLLFTPLLTNGLSAIRPELNSYGSAIVGTIQQVSGAAGIALFISVAAAAGGPALNSPSKRKFRNPLATMEAQT
mgnify:CR=1 FL=1